MSLVKVAAGDPSTRLGAALAGWAYPASIPDLALIAFAAGKSADRVMPGSLGARMREQAISAEERHDAAVRLASVSAFRDRPEFDIG